MTVREILHAHIPNLTLESTLRDAVDKIDIYQFPALVILDQNQKVYGVITEGDICRQLKTQEALLKNSSTLAHQYGTKNPLSISPLATVEEAFDLMISKKITILPVVENDRLTGIVLRADLMQAMLMMDAMQHTSNSKP